MHNALQTYRLKNELSLQSLAEACGVNRSTVFRWEQGRVPAERVLAIERATGIARHELRPDLYQPAEAAE